MLFLLQHLPIALLSLLLHFIWASEMEAGLPEKKTECFFTIFSIYKLERGICLLVFLQDGGRTNEQKDEMQIEPYVVQRYIENPYLIGGERPI